MKFLYKTVALILLSSTFTAVAQVNESQVSSEWVVVFEDPRPARLQGWSKTGYSKQNGDYRDSLELKRFGKKIASKYNLELRDQWLIQSLGVYCLVVKFNDDQQQTIEQLNRNRRVQWVQPSNEFNILSSKSVTNDASPTAFRSGEVVPLPNSMDGSGVVIAMIDSGVDKSHRDLSAADVKSENFVVLGEPYAGGEAHGTAIASVIVTQRETQLGVAGIAPAVTLEVYRSCWESKKESGSNCNTLSLALALDAVARSDASIVNLSLSGPKDALLDRLTHKLIDQGRVVVAAFDPSRDEESRFPSKRKGVLVVRAQGLDKSHANVFSAPGARVVASPGNRYDFMQGHSIATAYVSGVLALRKQVWGQPNLNAKTDWRNISQSKAARDLVQELLHITPQVNELNMNNSVKISLLDH
ncbi:MAG: S8 family serine peptidase [Arenicella sp.]|nr:S8 family serine peptidase [Arenicella sp.]